jgi:2-methylisocitrate lyase-like PEP mutase family enzyme
MKDLKATRQRFRSMHDGFFVIPNAWNVGEIRQLEKLDFGAIATTSAGLSASMGRDDLSLSRDETLQNIRCACRKSNTHIQMMESAKKWRRHNATNGVYCSRHRGVLVD